MSTNSETILSQQTHPGDSSNETLTGDPYKGDGFYGRSDGLHTVQINLSGFIGSVAIQATLETNPTDNSWFTVYSQNYPVVADQGTTGSYLTNFTGNYVWVRAFISNWSDGTVNSIKLNH
jgi:hypothetical protein